MSLGAISCVRVAGIAAAVPAAKRAVCEEAEIFGEKEVAQIIQNTGVRSRHVATGRICTSDLCYAAAERLITELDWSRDEIGGLIFISQTPDYVLPATSCRLQARLGLPTSCWAFDVNLGCSGYVYGLWIASSLLQTAKGKVLLLIGDTITRTTSPEDRSVGLLFGDAGTATALEAGEGTAPMHFALGTDGTGQDHLIIPAGGFRHPRNQASSLRTMREGGNIRGDEDLFMDGAEVFSFTLLRVPPLVRAALREAGCGVEDIDAFVFHQANRFMLQHLAKRMKLPLEKVLLEMEQYGNTSSASIPLALIASPWRDKLRTTSLRLLLAGFGVGFSWAAAVLRCGPMIAPEVIEVSEAKQ